MSFNYLDTSQITHKERLPGVSSQGDINGKTDFFSEIFWNICLKVQFVIFQSARKHKVQTFKLFLYLLNGNIFIHISHHATRGSKRKKILHTFGQQFQVEKLFSFNLEKKLKFFPGPFLRNCCLKIRHFSMKNILTSKKYLEDPI